MDLSTANLAKVFKPRATPTVRLYFSGSIRTTRDILRGSLSMRIQACFSHGPFLVNSEHQQFDAPARAVARL